MAEQSKADLLNELRELLLQLTPEQFDAIEANVQSMAKQQGK